MEVSEGLGHIIENAERICEGAIALLDSENSQSLNILSMHAEEEAAKFLILIDAVRCPISEQKRRSDLLGCLRSHLARGIYAELAATRPVDLAELRKLADYYRRSLYLDGPMDVDFIMRNQVVSRREELIYVDYVESEGEHFWISPRNDPEFGTFRHIEPYTLRIARALSETGVTTFEGLEIVANVWRRFEVSDQTSWDEIESMNQKTLVLLEEKGLMHDCSEDTIRFLIQWWLFPLYTLDLSQINVSIDSLEAQRERFLWSMY